MLRSGQDAVEFPMPDGRTAVCVYKYFSLLFIFKLARKQEWYIIERQPSSASLTDGAFRQGAGHGAGQGAGQGEAMAPPPSPQQPATRWASYDEIAAAFSPQDPPSLNWFQRFGAVIPAVGLAVLVGVAAYSARGTTGVAVLDVGDCFVQSAETEVSRLTTPDCAEFHDAQIVAIFDVEDAPDDLPDTADAFWTEVFDRCVSESDLVMTRTDELPSTAYMSFFSPNERGWARGDHEIVCYVADSGPSGLDGSFVTGG